MSLIVKDCPDGLIGGISSESFAREEAGRISREEDERIAREEAARIAREEYERIASENAKRIERLRRPAIIIYLIIVIIIVFGLGLGLGLGLPHYPEELLVRSSGPAAYHQAECMGLYKKTDLKRGSRPVWRKVGASDINPRFLLWKGCGVFGWGKWIIRSYTNISSISSSDHLIISKWYLLPRIPNSGWKYANYHGPDEPDDTLTVEGKGVSTLTLYISYH